MSSVTRRDHFKDKDSDPLSGLFQERLVPAIAQLMNPERAQYEKAFGPGHSAPGPLDFEKVLGPESKGTQSYWWRLYISKEDWYNAQTKVNAEVREIKKTDPESLQVPATTEDPGLWYDVDPGTYNADEEDEVEFEELKKAESEEPKEEPKKRPTGYQDCMVNLYKATLSTGDLAAKILHDDFGWVQYQDLWKQAIRGMKDEHDFQLRGPISVEPHTPFPSFGVSPVLASDAIDVGKDKIDFKADKGATLSLPLAKQLKLKDADTDHFDIDRDELKQPPSSVTNHYEKMEDLLVPRLAPEHYPLAVDASFKEFRTNIKAATSSQGQLRAIVRLVRKLHMLHCFDDGCGRVNVYTILPALLLHYGFGLPLGGKHKDVLHRGAMFGLFNGGFTIDEMAEYLWLAQDYGLLKRDFPTSIRDPPEGGSHVPVAEHSPSGSLGTQSSSSGGDKTRVNKKSVL